MTRNLGTESLNNVVLQQFERFDIEKRIFAAGENSRVYKSFRQVQEKIIEFQALSQLKQLGPSYFNMGLFHYPEYLRKSFQLQSLPEHFLALMKLRGFETTHLPEEGTQDTHDLVNGDNLAFRILEDLLGRLKKYKLPPKY